MKENFENQIGKDRIRNRENLVQGCAKGEMTFYESMLRPNRLEPCNVSLRHDFSRGYMCRETTCVCTTFTL